MHRGAGESHHSAGSAGWIPAAMDNGIPNAFIGGVGQDGICVHQPAQLEDPEHHGKDDDDHERCFQQTLAPLAW